MAVVIQLIADYALWLYALCAVGILLYLRAAWVARRECKQALFTLEREAASSRTVRGVVGVVVFLGLAGSVFFVEAMLAPRMPVTIEEEDERAINTVFFLTSTPSLPTNTPLPPSPTLQPSPTATRYIAPTAVPSPTPTPAPIAACSSIAQITSPRVGAVLAGRILIYGTAAAPDFNFYKIEYHREGEPETAWHSISDIHRDQVVNGVLDAWDVSIFPAGPYHLRLTVVDITGNYPPQNICEVPVTVVH